MTMLSKAVLAFLVGVALAALSLPAYAGSSESGSGLLAQKQIASVPTPRMVTVKNPDGIGYDRHSAGEALFDFNEQCEIQKHGLVGFLAEFDEKNYLVKYLGGKRVEGLSCPDGTLAVMPNEEYEQMSEDYEALFLVETEEKEKIRSLLSGIYRPAP